MMRGQDDFEAAFDRLLGLSYRHARRLVGDPEITAEAEVCGARPSEATASTTVTVVAG